MFINNANFIKYIMYMSEKSYISILYFDFYFLILNLEICAEIIIINNYYRLHLLIQIDNFDLQIT